MTSVPAPAIDPDSSPFWEGLAEHRLLVQRCDSCGRYRFPSCAICPTCRSRTSNWTPVSGLGRVLSWIVTHEIAHPAFVDQLPYVTLFVELSEQEGLVMYGNLRPHDAAVAHLMSVRAVFEDDPRGFTLVQWTPVER